MLATCTVKRRALSLGDTTNRPLALCAGFIFATINVQGLGKVARLSITAGKVFECGAALFYRIT